MRQYIVPGSGCIPGAFARSPSPLSVWAPLSLGVWMPTSVIATGKTSLGH